MNIKPLILSDTVVAKTTATCNDNTIPGQMVVTLNQKFSFDTITDKVYLEQTDLEKLFQWAAENKLIDLNQTFEEKIKSEQKNKLIDYLRQIGYGLAADRVQVAIID